MKPETLLLRQVHPDFIPEAQLTSQAFMPFPKDKGKLSVYDGDQISPQDSYKHYTEILGNKAAGVWGVTCAEVSTVGLASAPDPLENFPSHAVVDFTALPEKSFRKLAKRLKSAAVARGCLHAPA